MNETQSVLHIELSWFRAVFLGCVVSSHTCIWNKVFEPCEINHCASARTWALTGHRGFVKRTQIVKSITCACTRATLTQPNLSNTNLQGVPVVIHSSKTTCSKFTQNKPIRIDESRDVNENHRFSYLVSWVWACCLPWLGYIFTCLYSIPQTKSLSHVEQIIARQRKPVISERSPEPRQLTNTWHSLHLHAHARVWSRPVVLIRISGMSFCNP